MADTIIDPETSERLITCFGPTGQTGAVFARHDDPRILLAGATVYL